MIFKLAEPVKRGQAFFNAVRLFASGLANCRIAISSGSGDLMLRPRANHYWRYGWVTRECRPGAMMPSGSSANFSLVTTSQKVALDDVS